MSNRNVRVVVFVLLLLGLIGAAAVAFIYITGGSGEASTTLTAPTLERRATSTPEVVVTEEVTEDDATQEVAETEEAVVEATEEAAPAESVVFEIVKDESQVQFELSEELRGQPTQVVGTTNEVVGQILVDFANPANSQVGTIRINLRTLATDNDFRNRAIRGQILRSAQDEYEFTDFVPTAVDGLPATVTIGEPFKFTLTGDLTLLDTTNPVTFNVMVTPVSETRIEGTATSVVNRTDYGLTIPNAPGVANVAEEVTLTINFVAEAVD